MDGHWDPIGKDSDAGRDRGQDTNYVFFTKLPWWASLVAQQVKNPPAMWETWV